MNCFTSVQKQNPKLSLWGNSIAITPRHDDTWLVVEPTLKIEPSSKIMGGEQALNDFMHMQPGSDFDSNDMLECREDLIKSLFQKDSTKAKCQRRRQQEIGPDERLSPEKHPIRANRLDHMVTSKSFHNSAIFEDTPQLYISSFSRLCKPVPPRSDLNKPQVASWGTFSWEDSKKKPTAFDAILEIEQSSLKKMELKSELLSNTNGTHRSLVTPRPRNESTCRIVDINLIVPAQGAQGCTPPLSTHCVVDSQPADQNQHESQSSLQPTRPNSARVIRRPEPVQMFSKLPCNDSSPIINFSLQIPEMSLSTKKIRPKTATHALHTKPCWPSGMRTGLTSRTVVSGCDNIQGNKGLAFPCGVALDSTGRTRINHAENSENGALESSSSTAKGHDLIHLTAHSIPLDIPPEVERWSALPPNCGESRHLQFPRVPESPRSPAVRPGSALRPWSGRAKKGELSDHSIDQLGKESIDALKKVKPIKHVGTSESQSQHSKKYLPKKAGNEAVLVPKQQISDPPQLENMLSLASTKKNSVAQNKSYRAQNGVVCFVCSSCGRIQQDKIQGDVKQDPAGQVPDLQQPTSPVLVLNYISDSLSPCNLNAVSDCQVLESGETSSVPVESAKPNVNITVPAQSTNQQREPQEFQSYIDRSQDLIRTVEIVADEISNLLISISSQINHLNEQYCSLQVETRKNEGIFHAQQRTSDECKKEVEGLKQNIHELESIVEHLDLKSKTTQIMEKWELNKKMIGLSERAVLNALAGALVIQEKRLEESKAEAQTILHKAESVWEQQKLNEKLDQDLATRELQCRLMETLLAKQETELNSRHSALRTELELAVGDQIIEKSSLLKELRLLVVDNERLKLKLLDVESQVADTQGSE